ncbi:hypothetical protein [Massilia haematophila]|uniref:Uncharacterized protein n=1 Tax=Massilia haematophila TaxID=457923 RepID=A0ABV7PQJ1_9BURK
MYLDILNEIDNLRTTRFLPISTNAKGYPVINEPLNACAGLYFLYTSYSIDELCTIAELPGASVPIARLTQAHHLLPNVCQIEQDGFRLVYNGIGGYAGGSYGLRRRILQEISAPDIRTGSLRIMQSAVNDLARWRFSYVTLHSEMQKSAADFGPEWGFAEHAKSLERCWRLAHGWPLLCRT